MNKPFYILFFVLILSVFQYKYSTAQTNLVYNGDFELFSTCPSGTGGLSDCTGWLNPTTATPDYFNACAGASIVGIPNNAGGSQNAFSGDGYAGFIAFEYVPGPTSWWFEYIQGEFIQPLLAGHKYELTFYVSCGEGYADIAISKIGAYSSVLPISRTDSNPFLLIPQVVNSNGVISDTAGWTKISGTFIASGNEQFITLGYFSDTIITDSLRIQTFSFNPTSTPRTYYYVDGINVIDVTPEINIPNIFSPNGDGVNDFLDISNFGLSEISFCIFNRWGIKVFETNKVGDKWDGRTTSGISCNDGTYFYVLKAKDDKTNYDLKGFIQLLR